MKSAKWIVVCCLLARPAFGQNMGELINSHGFKGGIVVHLGCGGGEKTARLFVNDRCLVHGLDRNDANVDRARRHIILQGLYGRVSAMTLSGNRLPYADNMINLIVAEKPDGISIDEMRRVLVPNGTALISSGQRWRKVTKSIPPEIDELLLPLEAGLTDLPELSATAEGAARMKNGNPGMVIASDVEYGDLAWASYQGQPVAVGTYRAGELHPSRVFNL